MVKLLRFLLFPLAIIYDAITRVRNIGFNLGVLKSTSFDVPVIAVGNLSVGGTGKTPQIEYLIELLQNEYKVAVLSRGYKRKTKGFLQINDYHTVEDVGDEPLQFYKKYSNKITVAVDANRARGIKKLLQQASAPNLILLDDAFQHRKVKASQYIMLTKFDDLYTDDFLLPYGTLREARVGAKRADIIIVTKCPNTITLKEQEQISAKLAVQHNQKIFFSKIIYKSILLGNKTLDLQLLKFRQVVLITGIANPTPLLNFLSSLQIKFVHLSYPDHYFFTSKDLEKIKNVYEKIEDDKKIFLTTEKDFVRLEYFLDQLYYLPIGIQFLEKQGEFDNLIKQNIT